MPRSGPRQINKYSKEFKLAAVRLSHLPGSPSMRRKWRTGRATA